MNIELNWMNRNYLPCIWPRFWTPQFLVLLAFIFKLRWNPVSVNHNFNVTPTDFSLSVIEEPVIRSIWCLRALIVNLTITSQDGVATTTAFGQASQVYCF